MNHKYQNLSHKPLVYRNMILLDQPSMIVKEKYYPELELMRFPIGDQLMTTDKLGNFLS